MVKVLIVDDHPIVRKGLKQILAETKDMIVKDEASTCNEAMEKVKNNHYDLIILDISLPDKNGLEIIKDLKINKPSLPILILTMHSEDQFAVRVLKAGASGFLNKDSVSGQLVAAIRKIVSGGKYISERVVEKLTENLKVKQNIFIHEILSDREFEVMCLIAQGKKIKEVGQILNLSPKTVSTYRYRILEKMNMQKDSEIIIYAFRNKLIDV